jgi:hypothetical protein
MLLLLGISRKQISEMAIPMTRVYYRMFLILTLKRNTKGRDYGQSEKEIEPWRPQLALFGSPG